MLSSEMLAVRLGGIYALQTLADKYPTEYHVQVMRLLAAFVSNPRKDEQLDKPIFVGDDVLPPTVRNDVQVAVSIIGQRSPARIKYETEADFRLDLRGANLRRAQLRHHLLDGADLTNAQLDMANLEIASVAGAWLNNASLNSANLEGANFSGSNCKWATFTQASASGANFRRAYLEGTLWINADLEATDLTETKLIGADLTSAKLDQANISHAWFGVGGRPEGDPPYDFIRKKCTTLTQEQLDKAVAPGDSPPKIENSVTDPKSGARLRWNQVPEPPATR